jgi:hypothetical protein
MHNKMFTASLAEKIMTKVQSANKVPNKVPNWLPKIKNAFLTKKDEAPFLISHRGKLFLQSLQAETNGRN